MILSKKADSERFRLLKGYGKQKSDINYTYKKIFEMTKE